MCLAKVRGARTAWSLKSRLVLAGKVLTTRTFKLPYFLAMGPFMLGSNRALGVNACIAAEGAEAGLGRGEVQAAVENFLAIIHALTPQLNAALYAANPRSVFVVAAISTLFSQVPLTWALRAQRKRSLSSDEPSPS